MSRSKEILGVLVDLLLRNIDDHSTLMTAAKLVKKEHDKKLLETLANRRLQYLQELKEQIVLLGGKVKEHISLKGKVDKFLITLTFKLSRRTTEALMTECLILEGETIQEYKEALDHKGLPEEYYAIFNKHKADLTTMVKKTFEPISERVLMAS